MKSFILRILASFSPVKEHKTGIIGKWTPFLLFLSILSVFFESLLQNSSLLLFFRVFSFLSILLFTGEYFLRIFAASLFLSKKTLRGFFSLLLFLEGIILFLGIWHFFSPDILDLRVFWIFRIFHFWEKVPFFAILLRIFRQHKKVLLFSIFLMASMVIIFATLIFFAEHRAQPEKFSNIPQSMWWAIVTFFTIGYGDMYPITDAGKIIATFASFFGITTFALPTIIVWSAFFNELLSQEHQKRERLEKRLMELEKGQKVQRKKSFDSDFPVLLQKR